jgi:transposase-like protein
MLFFPTPYPDELLFSICSRYYIRSGNISYKGTLDDLYSNRSLTASVFLPSGISALLMNMPPYHSFNETDLIYNHTFFLFYTAFLPKEKADSIFQSMYSNDGRSVYVQSGINASGVPQNKFLRYCAICNKEDIELYGELYWHRSHQISGIQCCLKHLTPLYNSSIEVIGQNKHRFQIPTSENCSAKEHVLANVPLDLQLKYIELLNQLTEGINHLLNQSFEYKDLNWFSQVYRKQMTSMDLAYYTDRVKQKEWRNYFESKYNKEVLHLLHSSLTHEQDWLSMIVQKNRKSFHPLRHLLVMYALDLYPEKLFDNYLPLPFGYPNWPCNNIVCPSYRSLLIKEVSITLCENTKKPIGTFKCPTCGFTYSRRGPDGSETDKMRRNKVKQYGWLWKRKLSEFSTEGISLRELSRRLGADPNTIKRYLKQEEKRKLPFVNSLEEKRNNDKRGWLQLRSNHPEKSLRELRDLDKALYMRLYRSDQEWLSANSPEKIKRTAKQRVDWSKRDEEVLSKVKDAIEKLLNNEDKPVRITLSRIAYLIGNKALLEKKLNLLPKTQQYLKRRLETIEEFQKRRAIFIIKLFIGEGIRPSNWEVLRKAGLKSTEEWNRWIEQKIAEQSLTFRHY